MVSVLKINYLSNLKERQFLASYSEKREPFIPSVFAISLVFYGEGFLVTSKNHQVESHFLPAFDKL